MNRIIAGIGEILWDMLPSGKMLGGAPANFAYHASQAGHKAVVVSAVGNDQPGDEIISVLNSHNICHEIQRTPLPTGTVSVTLSDNGIPTYEITRDTAWDNISFSPQLARMASLCRAVCFGTLAQRSALSRETILSFVKATPADCLKVFDINLRQHFYSAEIIEQSLHLCDTLKINDDELITITALLSLGNNPCHEIMQRYNIATVIVTCGIYGSYIHTADDSSFLPTPRVKVADTVGAGDAFTAAFITSVLNGDDIATAHRHAVDLSALVCTHTGAM